MGTTTTTYLNTENLKIILDTIISLAPIIACYIGIHYGLKQIKIQKKIDLIENQLNKFYSPLLGLIKEIQAKSELRHKISQLGDESWKEACKKEEMPNITPYKEETKYNNQQLFTEFLPKYNKMLDIFRDNYWLSEPETRKFYSQFVEFVEIWNRHFSEGLPHDVVRKINHKEEDLTPFYEELELRTNELRKKILKIK